MKRSKLLLTSILAALCLAQPFFALSAKAEAVPVSITLCFAGTKVVYEDKQIFEPDFTVTTDFHERRINASYAEKLECVEKSLAGGATPKSAILYTFPLLEEKVNTFLSGVNRAPEDASINFKPYGSPMFTIKEERDGYDVNEQRLYYDIYSALKNSAIVTVNARAEVLAPNVTAEQLKKFTHLRSAFSTDYSSSNENRKHNIRLALSKINGKRIDDGEEFSFNAAVGKRTEANGFTEAKIIMDGQYVDGVGGGVCQASTTLYNCALVADMKITSVRAHTLAPSYVPPSFDAMVNSETSDLKFKNESGGPVFIRAYGTDTTATVQLYGAKLPYEIRRESSIISRTAIPKDETLIDEKGEYGTEEMNYGEVKRVRFGVAGISSEGYLCYYKSGRLIDKRLIRHDVYRPVRGLVVSPPERAVWLSSVDYRQNSQRLAGLTY